MFYLVSAELNSYTIAGMKSLETDHLSALWAHKSGMKKKTKNM